MNIIELQNWLNLKGANIKVDGIGGSITRDAFIKVFTNPSYKKITENDLLVISKKLGDTSTKRLKAVSLVESGGSGFLENGLPKILWERQLFYKFTNKTIYFIGNTKQFLSAQTSGDYTLDANNNKINDSWEKLAQGVTIDVDGALQSVSMGKFQVLGKYYKECGFANPLEMLYACSQSEYTHYDIFASYILKVAFLKNAFLKISTNPNDCIPFARGYNGIAYTRFQYNTKIANSMK